MRNANSGRQQPTPAVPAIPARALTRRAFLRTSLAVPVMAASRSAFALAGKMDGRHPDLRGLPGYVQHVMRQLRVPGAAVAIVHEDRVLFCHGFGVKSLSSGEPVTENTLFSLASQTKPFTGTCFAMLESEGRLQGDRPFLDYLPAFRMSSPDVTRRIKVSEVLSHISGLPAHAGDQLYFPATDYSLEQVVQRIRELPLVRPFLSTFAYENVLYAAAALMMQRVTGMTYEQFVSRRIFGPLGMRSTVPNASDLPAASDVATGHTEVDGILKPVPPIVWRNNPGAGGIYSSASDLTRWMRMHLRGGVYRSSPGSLQRLYSARAQQEMWTSRISIPLGEDASEADRIQYEDLAYGAGWFLSKYRGERLMWHSGEFPGFVSKIALMPSHRLGVVVLTNQEVDTAFRAITNHVLDLFMGAHDIDWLASLMRERDAAKAAKEKRLAAVMATRTLRADAPMDCGAFEGTYRDAWYGDVRIWRSGGKCLMHFVHTQELIGEVHPWARDTFVVRWRDRLLKGDALMSFEKNPAGEVVAARMKRLSPFEAPAFDFRDLHLARVRKS